MEDGSEEEEDDVKKRRSDGYSLTFDDSLSWCVIGGLGGGRDRHSSRSSDSHSTVSVVHKMHTCLIFVLHFNFVCLLFSLRGQSLQLQHPTRTVTTSVLNSRLNPLIQMITTKTMPLYLQMTR